MKRKNVRAFLIDSKKKKKVINKIIIIIVLLLCVASFTYAYYLLNQKHYVKYTEDGKLDYKVYLKNNDFFNNEYLNSEKEYVTSLIDYINAEFDYKLQTEETDVDYSYTYRTEAVVDIIRKDNKNTLYDFSEEISAPETENTTDRQVALNKFAKVDYNKYNKIAKDFISLYKLDNAEATLTINFYVDVKGNSDILEKDVNNESVYSLSMPLNENTINLETNHVEKDESENVIACKKETTHSYVLLIVATLLLIFIINKIVELVQYIERNRTAESIYDRELRKILNNYSSYIQKVNNGFNIKEHTVLEVDTFNDMLEIRETIQEPIIMLENDEKTETYFMIMGKMNIIYVYYIKVSDIKTKKHKKREIVQL